MMGRHMLSAWSSTQAVIALSSGEAELYAMVKGATHTLGMLSLAADFGSTLGAQIRGDSTAAIGIVNRTGVGKLRHIRVQYLCLQERVRDGDVTVKKVLGTENAADLFTKNLAETQMNEHIARLGFDKLKDRPATAPALAMLTGVSTAQRPRFEKPDVADHISDQRRGVTQEDWWHAGTEDMTRHHARPRRELFTPKYVENGPAKQDICKVRITEGHYIDDGSSFKRVDSWAARKDAHLSLERPWLGTTKFLYRVGE